MTKLQELKMLSLENNGQMLTLENIDQNNHLPASKHFSVPRFGPSFFKSLLH